ncbi:MAG: AIR synthase related protein, partial [Acidobacteria bacterium]|nr:AIR synthase related protein [Acidobacteriota bacterium]
GDAAIVRIKETGTSIAMSLDGNGRYCYLDPREGAKLIVAECCRNLSVVGALPVSATNNLNFGNPERPEIMAQLVEGIEGLAEACKFFETPITGGNVSLYNETLGESIFPTPVVGIVGLLPTVAPIPMAFPKAGLDLVLLGGLGDSDLTHFGGTQYAKQVLGALWGLPPKLDMPLEKRVQEATREIVRANLTEAAHDLGDVGLAVALAEGTFAGVGAEVDIKTDLRAEFALFHEGASRVLLATSKPEEIVAIAARHQVPALVLGKTTAGTLKIALNGTQVVHVGVDKLYHTWDRALEESLHV